MHVACDEAERQVLVCGLFNLARTEHTRGVAIEQQTQQDFRCIRWRTTRPIAGIDGCQVEQGNHVDNEACQMVGGDAVPQTNGDVDGGIVIHLYEGTSHERLRLLSGHGWSGLLVYHEVGCRWCRFLRQAARPTLCATERVHKGRPARSIRSRKAAVRVGSSWLLNNA